MTDIDQAAMDAAYNAFAEAGGEGIGAMVSALYAYERALWQPIATAPRDKLLLLWGGDAPVVAYYHRAAWRVGPKGYVVAASHWRPLPEGPTV